MVQKKSLTDFFVDHCAYFLQCQFQITTASKAVAEKYPAFDQHHEKLAIVVGADVPAKLSCFLTLSDNGSNSPDQRSKGVLDLFQKFRDTVVRFRGRIEHWTSAGLYQHLALFPVKRNDSIELIERIFRRPYVRVERILQSAHIIAIRFHGYFLLILEVAVNAAFGKARYFQHIIERSGGHSFFIEEGRRLFNYKLSGAFGF